MVDYQPDPDQEPNQDLEAPEDSDLSEGEWILTIAGTGEYEVRVDGGIEGVSTYDATVDLDDPTSIDQIVREGFRADSAHDALARGSVDGGRDSYLVDGLVTSVIESENGDIRYYANGTRIPRNDLFKRSDDSDDSDDDSTPTPSGLFDNLDSAQSAALGASAIGLIIVLAIVAL